MALFEPDRPEALAGQHEKVIPELRILKVARNEFSVQHAVVDVRGRA
jgi:hypothetical protein